MQSPGVLLMVCLGYQLCPLTKSDLTSEPGHLKPLGQGRPALNIEEFDGFPNTRHFFETYVLPPKPLLMKGAAKLSKAFTLWQDDYFMKAHVPEKVVVESRKKEDRLAPAEEMYFKEFVMIYNRTDQYMVNPVPHPLGVDVVLPGPLQCQQILDNNMLLENMMWFSSGGTKSVLHTDSVDNINCLFRGEKTFVMIDPDKYADKVDIDHPEGSYSGVDVDSVDYTKYPGLAQVEFITVHMTAGDCLYIPFKWIHQVRSFGSNIAVNVWWDFHKNTKIDLDQCQQQFNKDLTLDKVDFKGLNSLMDEIPAIRKVLSIYSRRNPVTLEIVKRFFVQEMSEDILNRSGGIQSLLAGIVDALDKDKDGQATEQEINDSTDEDWNMVKERVGQLDYLMKAMQEQEGESDTSNSLLYNDEEFNRDEL